MKQKLDTKAPLITCEGIDGSGKSTIAQKLHSYLVSQSVNVFLTKEPGGTELGKQIREILQHHHEPINPISEFLLFAADRAHHITTVVQPHLAQGTWVISDRMHDSSVAYQGYGRGLSIEKIIEINKWALQGESQDLTIYLKIDPQTAHERINKRNETRTRFEKETANFWQRITNGFEEIFKTRNNVLTVDATQNPEKIMHDIITQKLFIQLMEKHAAQ